MPGRRPPPSPRRSARRRSRSHSPSSRCAQIGGIASGFPLGRGLLFGASEEAFIHRIGCGVGTVVKGAKKLVEHHRAVATVVAFEVFVMEIMEEISGLDLNPPVHNNLLQAG